MSRAYSLAFLTTPGLLPPQTCEIAARTGYRHIGVRLLPAVPGGACAPLISDSVLMADTLRALDATGVTVFDIEMIRIGPDFRAADHLAFYETAAALGASAVLVAGDDSDEARLTTSFAALCEALAGYHLTADLEFMPWTQVRDARTALRIVEAAGMPNGRVLVDALHAARSSTSIADIGTIPRERLSYAQICDAPAEVPTTDAELIHTARCARVLPGEGGIDLSAMFAGLPPDLPVSVEIPNDARIPAIGVEAWAREALERSRATID